MCRNTISSPASGVSGGVTGTPFSKKSIGDFTGSNFEGAHHLKRLAQKQIKIYIYLMKTKQKDDAEVFK